MLNSPVWRGFPQFAFCLGQVLGGLATATGLLVLGSLARLAAPPIVFVVAVVGWFAVIAVREFGLIGFPLPQNARLVPESVFRHGRFFGPLQFGLEMGTGLRTYVTSGLPYVALPLVAFFASPLAAVAAGVGFGLGRSLMTTSNLAVQRRQHMGPGVPSSPTADQVHPGRGVRHVDVGGAELS